MGEHDCRQQKHYKAVCYMLGISANTGTQEDNLIWSVMQALGASHQIYSDTFTGR